ncbi:hypothetical protein [Luteibacter sp.]|uniref:hypothetical protein n=1 Tax=Luteibacter sp. TaxID=1886636 RepID=UPI002F3EFC06
MTTLGTLRAALLPLAFVALLAGCQSSEVPTPAAAAAPASPSTSVNALTAPAPENAANVCPANTFDDFLPKFSDDVSVQKRYIVDPLESDTIDANAEPEPAPVKKMLTKDQITFPVMPDSARQHKDGLVLKKTPEGDAGFAVELAKPDTDYQMTFHFRSAEGCWQLYRTEDDSL